MSTFNEVQNDRQWIRRIMREEQHLVDRMNQKQFTFQQDPQKIEPFGLLKKSATPSIHSIKLSSKSGTTVRSRYTEEEKRDRDDLSDVSRVSVETPKTAYSSSTLSIRSSRSIGYSIAKSTSTTLEKMKRLKEELEEEKRKREQVERQLADLQGKDISL